MGECHEHHFKCNEHHSKSHVHRFKCNKQHSKCNKQHSKCHEPTDLIECVSGYEYGERESDRAAGLPGGKNHTMRFWWCVAISLGCCVSFLHVVQEFILGT